MPVPSMKAVGGTCVGAARNDFTPLEWLVIAIGAQDESVPLQWSPIGRSLLALLGGGPKPLASPCLETLRQTACVARHYGWAIPSAELGAFLRCGWSETQLERLIESVSPEEPFIDEWQPCAPVDGAPSVESRSEIRTLMEVFS